MKDGFIMYLYHEHNSHYDLLIDRQYLFSEDSIFKEEETEVAHDVDDDIEDSLPNISTAPKDSTELPSPMIFHPHVKSKGRPKK